MPISENPPVVHCYPLDAFESSSVEAVKSALSGATPISLRQFWRRQPEDDFKPASVRTGWQRDAFLVLAELDDLDIFNSATEVNQRAWETGDVFEIFLRDEKEEAYVEFHITPENQHLQLRFEGSGKTGKMIDDEVFRSRTWVEPHLDRWFVYAEIPTAAVSENEMPLAGRRWRFSFSRYDYTRGRKGAVISSSSPHAEASFHRTHEWGYLVFEQQSA